MVRTGEGDVNNGACRVSSVRGTPYAPFRDIGVTLDYDWTMRHAPRLVVFAIDLLITTLAVIAAFVVRFDFSVPDALWGSSVVYFLCLLLPLRIVTFFVFKTYRGVVRYTTVGDAERILFATSVSSLLAFLVVFFARDDAQYIVPRSVVVIEYVMATLVMIASRMGVRITYGMLRRERGVERLVVVGNEEAALQVCRALERDLERNVLVVGIIIPGWRYGSSMMEDIPVYPLERINSVLRRSGVNKLVMTASGISQSDRDRIMAICLRRKVLVLKSPDISGWLSGDLKYRQLKRLDINDLLMRPPIHLDLKEIEAYLSGKVVLITGAVGSIGSEIARQVAKFKPSQLLLFDQAETPLYQLDLEMREQKGFVDYRIIIGNAFDAVRVRPIFEQYRPNVVFHAAAYKHVPMMEDNPYEAVANNVRSTMLLADLSVEFGVSRFVMVSTDKAVNPSNVMGASKRICEIYTQMFASMRVSTRFVTTRFGNVLGSNGSVVQRFQRQIEEGGPITLTHPEIRRFFMSIPEACQLVLQAGTMGQGGEIYVFDMGKPVKIRELAEKMIWLSGHVPGEEIKIVVTGLRPGEKLYEELLANEECTELTSHEKILQARVRSYEEGEVRRKIAALMDSLSTCDDFAIVRCMKDLVPEFVSKNSRFEVLDGVGEAGQG